MEKQALSKTKDKYTAPGVGAGADKYPLLIALDRTHDREAGVRGDK